MNLPDKILSKDEINGRFIQALYILLNNKVVENKATLADALGAKPSKFSEILNERMKAGADMLAILCNYYDISPDWLLMSRGSIFRKNELPPIIIEDNPCSVVPEHTESKTSAQEVSSEKPSNNEAIDILMNLLNGKDDTIQRQAEEIGRLKARIEELERERPVPTAPKYAHSISKETVET